MSTAVTKRSKRAALVLPGGLDAVTGGNIYDAEITGRLRERGWTVDVLEPGRALDGYDVVLLDSLAFPMGAIATTAPVVAVAHQLPSAARNRPDLRTAEREALARCRLVIAAAPHVASSIRRLVDRSVVVLQPGRDRAAWTGAPDPQRTVLTVGNAVPGKGLAETISAFSIARLPGARLVVAGDLDRDAGERAVVEQAASAAEGSVELTGILEGEDLAERYGTARAFVTSSRYEGWPIAVAEAMSSGLPVVAYDVPGMRELIRHNGEGFLAPPGDVPALADSLRRVWRDGDLAARIGEAARRKATRWPTWAETASRATVLIERAAIGASVDQLTGTR
jgi:glycosyltransferase involved in cell wall biosynthesis